MAMNTRFSLEDELAGETEGIVENWEACLSSFRSGAEL